MAGSADVVNVLLRCNANIELEDACGNTAFILACQWNHVEIAEILLSAGANIAKVNDDNRRGLDYLPPNSVLSCKLVRCYIYCPITHYYTACDGSYSRARTYYLLLVGAAFAVSW